LQLAIHYYSVDDALLKCIDFYVYVCMLVIVIQYGFVVMFTTAFPLAPLCALLNNVLEQRLDAFKMVAAQRRPVPSYYCTNKKYMNYIIRGHITCCDNCNKLYTWIRVLKIMSLISVLYNVSSNTLGNQLIYYSCNALVGSAGKLYLKQD